jgi:hypothetical protein
MTALRWLYHRLGQMACFAIAALALAALDTIGTPAALISVGFLIGGVALRAIHVWQQMDDPARE